MDEGTGFQIAKLSELIGEAINARIAWRTVREMKDDVPIPILLEDRDVLDYTLDHRETLLGILQSTTQGQAEEATTLEVPATESEEKE